MANLYRSQEMLDKYKAHRKAHPATDSCPLCSKEALKTFKHWKITTNEFPYDLIAKTHHMVLPIRHVSEDGLTSEEMGELVALKKEALTEYDFLMEATPKNKSIPAHHHIHLVIAKE